MIEIGKICNKHEDEYLMFDRVENKLHQRPDICAFLLLDKLLPNRGMDIVCAAGHDEIFLDADIEKLCNIATESDILTLIRCGVRYCEDTDSLAMFV